MTQYIYTCHSIYPIHDTVYPEREDVDTHPVQEALEEPFHRVQTGEHLLGVLYHTHTHTHAHGHAHTV